MGDYPNLGFARAVWRDAFVDNRDAMLCKPQFSKGAPSARAREVARNCVAKHLAGRYGEDEPTRWLKIKNPEYSQARDRAELFQR